MQFNAAAPAFEKPIPLYILLPLHPFVQTDMLSACIEYEDILSDKQRPSTYLYLSADFKRGCTAGNCGLKILIFDSGG